jgi:hypothetical protein
MQVKYIYVFLKNKIVSLDTIIPFCMEVNAQCNIEFIFVVRDSDTYRSITESNIVLLDAINSIGGVINLSKDRYKLRHISKIFMLLYMFYIVMRINTKKDYIIHFGLFNQKPFSLLCFLLDKKRIVFSSKSSYGRDDNVKHNFLCTGMLLGFSDSWRYLKGDSATDNIPKIIIKKSRNLPTWINFIKEKSDMYINLELKKKLLIGERIIFFPIGRINLDFTMTNSKSFIETLKRMAQYSNKYPIFIKPHSSVKLDYIRKLICDAEEDIKIKINYIFTKLHPSILASRAIASIFVSNSTIINEMYNLQVPIIQCFYGYESRNHSCCLVPLKDLISPKADHVITNYSGESLNKILDELIKDKVPPVTYGIAQENINCDLFCK